MGRSAPESIAAPLQEHCEMAGHVEQGVFCEADTGNLLKTMRGGDPVLLVAYTGSDYCTQHVFGNGKPVSIYKSSPSWIPGLWGIYEGQS